MLYSRAKAWSVRPSQLLGQRLASDDYVAFCIDDAVDRFGRAIEAELDGMKKNRTEKAEAFAARKQRMFLRLLGQEASIKYAQPVVG